MDAFLDKHDVEDCFAVGSSIKFCLVAKGDVDLFPRFNESSEWDTAAGDAIVRAAGGRVSANDGAPLRYKKPGFLNTPFLVEGA
jgi:3'(2'), 5'-bisphosphate nucleotidase